MTKRKLTKHEDDVRRGLRKSAEINPAQSPHDIIEEQDAQIEALKQDLLEQAAAVRQVAQDNKTETEAIRIENTRIKAEVERLKKAGDAMAKSIGENGVSNKGSFHDVADNIDQWYAAKEGKQS